MVLIATACGMVECESHEDCPAEKACINQECIEVCSLRDSCGQNALCQPVEHHARCVCPQCHSGDPRVACTPDPKCQETTPIPPQMKCKSNSQCPSSLSCHHGECRDPCLLSGPTCDSNKKCKVRNHRPQCVCKFGFSLSTNGELRCAPEMAECREDKDCPSNEACVLDKCQTPCFPSLCSENKTCLVLDHRPVCVCTKNCNPEVSICLKDAGCPPNLSCRNYQCINPCTNKNCPQDAPCFVEDHKAVCRFCPQGYTADLKNGCVKVVGCLDDSDCPEHQSCQEQACRDPCLTSNPCRDEEECQVHDHHPACVKVCQCQRNSDCHSNYICDGCHCIPPQRHDVGFACEHCPPGIPCDPLTGACIKVTCTTNEDCGLTEACIGHRCQHPCDVHNPCAQNAICVNTNHGCDCACSEGFHGNGYIGCVPVMSQKSVCQYNEDCPPERLCDRLNRVCINPCQGESCGENAECVPVNHGSQCRCPTGFSGNAYVSCTQVSGCRRDSECSRNEACIKGVCGNPCNCGTNAICEVINHKAVCKCLPGYGGNANIGCTGPLDPCEPNPCGTNALCEMDDGGPICYCPKGMTGNPFKNCIPEGGECTPNPCGPHSGCRVVQNSPVCFCLPEYEGNPPYEICSLPRHPCNPSPCGPNTQCSVMDNGFAKCTCLPGYLESPNTIRGCIERRNPCQPNPCGHGALCDKDRNPSCYCPEPLVGNPYRSCSEPVKTMCQPGPCGQNADCYVVSHSEQCYCRPGFIGDPYTTCQNEPASPCVPNPCGHHAICTMTSQGHPMCLCPDGMGGDPTTGCSGPQCTTDDGCPLEQACIGYRCKDPCPGSCGFQASCRVEKHHPVCTCNAGYMGNPLVRCYQIQDLEADKNPCIPSPCGLNTECRILSGHPVCSCLPGYIGEPRTGCRSECTLNSDCSSEMACINQACINPCHSANICGIGAICSCRDHTPSCACPPGFIGDPLIQCVQMITASPNTSLPCLPSPCNKGYLCTSMGEAAMCDPCGLPEARWNPQCRPECLSDSDCPFNRACLGKKCVDPCPGSCGINAQCTCMHHVPVCSCPGHLYGNPFEHCSPPPPEADDQVLTCQKQRCGANAICKESAGLIECICQRGFHGDPYMGCRPECVTNSECPHNTACLNYKCVNPCTGACGVNSQCSCINHVPVCHCPQNMEGNPFVSCYPTSPGGPTAVGHPENPCDPSPCGPNSRCIVSLHGYATCSCLPGYKGAPPVCQPECLVSAECRPDRACVNQKCINPCPGTCGINAICNVINHNPICSCPQGYLGDPFLNCHPSQAVDEEPKVPGHPCEPSPCGPNSICNVAAGRPVCSCATNFIGSPPYCRPECTLNQECSHNLACIQERCKDPCAHNCGRNAECHVVNHTPFCQCKPGYQGDAFISCSKIPPTALPEYPRDPCDKAPCGQNAQCTNHNGVPRCSCIPPYIGDPYGSGCRPECLMNSDCPSNQACLASHCRDPCPGVCGKNAQCSVVNHIPVCVCMQGYMGDPFQACRPKPVEDVPPQNPCEPSPCGPNSQCRVNGNTAVCSCIQNYIGSPPSCRPECIASSECPQNQACINLKCGDPCQGTCGLHAVCQVINHNPICSCPQNTVGDPFVRCVHEAPKVPQVASNPCMPSPCGGNSECRVFEHRPVCSCLPGMLGAPPNCRPECLIHADCPTRLACIGSKCKDPCSGSCGFNAICNVVNHQPLCTCQQGYQGDPFSGCSQATERTPEIIDPCFPSPCGANAECQNRNGVGACSCLAGFQGDPYAGCRRECESNQDCAQPLACIGFKCVNPCPGTCGVGAECIVANHIPICSCPAGFTGDPFLSCHPAPSKPQQSPKDPCLPSPCGPNSQCRTVNQQAVCSCLPNYIGHPPTCRPECVVSSECPLDKACINQKCSDPCPNTCGLHAQCTTKNHNPICACPQGYTGDPFSSCNLIPAAPPVPPTPEPVSCIPSPCGPNSQCQIVGGQIACSCLPNHIGVPPNCRPECVLSSECSSQLACINQRCRDPCPGSCGANAKCNIVNHVPVCSCDIGYTGDPFTLCSPVPITTPAPPIASDPCNPSPCGPNAICRPGGICECIAEYNGNPYEACRPECVLSTECPRDKTCQRNKCRDPCPGTCGQNAQCDVINHIPTCSCPQSFTGDPFSHCRAIPQDTLSPKDPCNPSPCGPNSKCQAPAGLAVCSCLTGYIGTPPSCRPECVLSNECSQTQACVNNKCTDPCAGSCGINARCQVINHSPICSCPNGHTGDPFRSCYPLPTLPPVQPVETPRDPCNPSPCGPNAQCQQSGGQASCSCLVNYVGAPPNCRPECIINPDCSSNEACINNKCVDPCPGTCGLNAQCAVISHAVSCSCLQGFTGNAFIQCIEQKQEEPMNPCEPSPCGPNAVCTQKNNAGSCSCIADYHGNPYEGCRPECVLSSDCTTDKACVRNKCQDPCPGVCGTNAQCNVVNHIPTCTCIQGYVGDPFTSCLLPPPQPVTEAAPADPCQPSPCGPNSQCRTTNGQAVCSCAPEFSGSPPNCRPECVVNSECPANRACYKRKCTDPCPGTCGINARCQIINHSPICSCPTGQTGDPFTRCFPIPVPPVAEKPASPVNPCIPSPCGPNSQCQVTAGTQASCSCQPNFIGTPPNCRPECLVNTDCPTNQACITEKCRDPCQGSCGLNADCRVQNHIPTCSCAPHYTGDPFSQCSPVIETPKPVESADPCSPSPCGVNTNCDNGVCTCLANYFGDPYTGCRPECTMNSDCVRQKACINQKCIDPCPGTCGQEAICDVINHIPTCSCPPPTSGDPFVLCRTKPVEAPRDPCNPTPCGPNSICRVSDNHAVCSCSPGQIGSPPQCRPECVVSAECTLTQACLNNKCTDPCPGICGIGARCNVVNHNPICSCPAGQTGDPFRQCFPIPVTPKPADPVNPCVPSPCGPNSQCQVKGESPACSCMPAFIGVPPNCRPECTINPECGSDRACVNQKCIDPCPGSCGSNAVCTVVNHTPICTCSPGYNGDPFTSCILVPAQPPKPVPPVNPCDPTPCGANAQCHIDGNSYAVCECLQDYQGNPYEGCRPECVVSSDCPMSQACLKNRCRDPCPGTCGLSAVCTVSNHIPICTCPPEYTGDAFTRCDYISKVVEEDPCYPSPCGPNTRCTSSSAGVALCECLPEFYGTPTDGCRPECTINSDCPRNKACASNKCKDPCVSGVCGYGAICQVLNHSPICSCPQGLVGNPFFECSKAPAPPQDPCNPSPCTVNGQCRVQNGQAVCTFPECVINQDCPRDKACFAQKCRDPCIDACGINAICQVVNHRAICSCSAGYTGEPRLSCNIIQATPPPECTQDSECANNKACINQRCSDPCQAETTSVCAYNAECRVLMHRPICVCRDGLTGNAHTQCFDIGCRSDSECPPTESCVNKECMNPCKLTQCGTNALCEVQGGRAQCLCLPGTNGNPFVSCERPQCTHDGECSSFLACRNEKCVDPCDCAPSAICTVSNHHPTCRCSPGYSGNPHELCTIEPVVDMTQCKMDADCPSKLACFSGQCKNPCFETQPCGKNAECQVVDTLPLRTMSCHCLTGFVGDADVQCIQDTSPEPGCNSDSECSSTEACINHKCINPCSVQNSCANNAICNAVNHKVACNCPDGFEGNPLINCYKRPTSGGCQHDNDCPSQHACINQWCQDPCKIGSPCGISAQCTTIQHRPSCACPQGWAGDPQTHCYKPECRADSDCLYDKACIAGNCLSPCREGSCGRGAECRAISHTAQCVCPAGTQGNPHVSCVTVVCQYNEDCADHEACDRLNRVCRPVCESDTCGTGASCLARDHQPKCVCQPGTQGDPYSECRGFDTAECTQDADCPSKMACINRKCQNPCSIPAVCALDQECRVQDTLPLRTVMCLCPPDTVASIDGHCRPIESKTGCKADSECPDSDRCVRGSCSEACRVDPCGLNALCTSTRHQGLCSCPPGYIGNPHIECSPGHAKIPTQFLPIPECSHDDDCPGDKRCRNQLCINPCITDPPCAAGAFCHMHDHQPICRCPAGFQGDPFNRCIPPPEASTGCASNSECTPKESCVNKLCVNPCNCGPNAECKVQNHYPICYCKSGYSGNPQIGCVKVGCEADSQCSDDKTCYNGECINPCIIGDPCGLNAVCYGSKHAAQCHCNPGYTGNPMQRCERIECTVDSQCPQDRTCHNHRCINPCSDLISPPCAANAICYVRSHQAGCRCPEHMPMGDPLSYCQRTPPVTVTSPECEKDIECPSKEACINNKCRNPCVELSPCTLSSMCSVFDTAPVRTMVCTCPEGWVPDNDGECKPVALPTPPGCTSDSECSINETCINRLCRNPCNCGPNAECFISNHRPICSCVPGYDGNPNLGCRIVGCRADSECGSGKACINGNCINPCVIEDPCGSNAECYAIGTRAECRCLSGYRGNPYDRCFVIGCRSNADCPSDRACINAQCINPCTYEHPCAPRAECIVQNHFPLCKCPPEYEGNPYTSCKLKIQPECRTDGDCPSLLACFNQQCKNPCQEIEPCQRPAQCEAISTLPVRTMLCECPPGYISSGSGTCKATPPVTAIGECIVDSDCPSDRSCINAICKNPCNCGPNADCRIRDHKPVCSCLPTFEGNPDLGCVKAGCRSDSDCSSQQACLNRECVPACSPDGSSCGTGAVCYGSHHTAVCECPPGMTGDPQVACVHIECENNSDCPSDKACINSHCRSPCVESNPCESPAECVSYNHVVDCVCPPGYVGDIRKGCVEVEKKCKSDSDCPSQTACINSDCVNPCNATEPCGKNSVCKVFDTFPVRTMICECLPGYRGNAAVECVRVSDCPPDKGFVRDENGNCVCPPGTGLNIYEECERCPPEKGMKIDSQGRCVCDLEKGLIIDERGNCVCPTDHGYKLDLNGNCLPGEECKTDNDCPDDRYCNTLTNTCINPCDDKQCGVNAFCNATNHVATCVCITGYIGDPEVHCKGTDYGRTDVRPELAISCLSYGIQVEVHILEKGFKGVFYVKGHSKDENCRRVVSLPNDSSSGTEIFKVTFGSCGLIHVNGQASFVLVYQKHPMLVTFKTQAYHIKCVYTTGEQNVTLGFNVSMLTTAGTIANTGPPPTCYMRIVTHTGQEINSAEIGDNLMLQVEVQPSTIYGGFARSCVAKTMEDTVENEYIVTDENGCATDPTIFGEWDYNPESHSLLANFNAFKFPSSDNIRFQCNIRVCFGKCQPVNCRGYNAFGRRRREIDDRNRTGAEIAESVPEGQLREEITIQSNAILTFERREERFIDPREGRLTPEVQQIDDICVSMIGFIIALVITALLALVAVAVAVSCWLVAYRRRPKTEGPLPHPPDFPNPLFTTPDPLAEPSPDYLS